MSISHQTVVQVQDAAILVELYMSFDLSDKKWQLTLSDGHRGPSRYSGGPGSGPGVSHLAK
jgi:transposase